MKNKSKKIFPKENKFELERQRCYYNQALVSYQETFKFARIALIMLFVANLAAFLLNPNFGFSFGVLSSISATALSHFSQHFYHQENRSAGNTLKGFAALIGVVSATLFAVSGFFINL